MEIQQRRWSLPASAAAAVVLMVAVAVVARAQPGMIRLGGGRTWTSTAAGQLPENVFPKADRQLLQLLATAGELIPRERYTEAIRCLQKILDSGEDHFFQPDSDVSIHRSLKAAAQQLVGEMPRAGRKTYRSLYEPNARQMLEEAVSSGDRVKLAEVSRRFYHTEAGYEATMLLALHHHDHGRSLAAALTLQRLGRAMPDASRFEPRFSLTLATCGLRTGMQDRARNALAALKQRRGNAAVTITGEQVRLPGGDDDAIDRLAALTGAAQPAETAQLDQWTLHRGNPSRNAATAASAPLLNLQWRIPATYIDELEESTLQRLMRERVQQGMSAVPALHPLAVHREFTVQLPGKPPRHIEDVVLMRTTKSLLAVDFATGRRLWETAVDHPWTARSLGTPAATIATNRLRRSTDLASRMWKDSTFGTLSSNGELVYSIEDLDSIAAPVRTAGGFNMVMGTSSSPYNRLAAHEIRTGKIRWHLGGPADDYPLREAGTFFLGPPLPLMGRLYVLAEIQNEIRLMVLDAKTGETLWDQHLAVAEINVSQDRTRRLAGASPSYADGILICPTSAGAVVAVDLATRSLLWGYCYHRDYTPNVSRSIIIVNGVRRSTSTPKDTWVDATAMVVDGRVLISPPESQWLHCLNLIDGKLLWRYKRDGDLYVACAHEGNVILVGRDKIRAVSVTETVERKETVQTVARTLGGRNTTSEEITVTAPKPAWDERTVDLSEGSTPAGRGIHSGNRYFLPLSNAEVVTIDLQAGKIVGSAKPRMNSVPGNLICYRGQIISQSYKGVQKYRQLESSREEVAERLAANPNDAEALLLQGEILASEGRHTEAVACFERAYQFDADPRTRVMLREALLEGLEREFAAHRGRAEQIEPLLDGSAQRVRYLRLMAVGLQHAGEWRASLDCCLKLIDLDPKDRTLDTLSGMHSVRRDRWVQARLAMLRAEANGEADSIDTVIEARLRVATASAGTGSLRQFLDYFGNQPAGAAARKELVRRLIAQRDLLGAELLLGPRPAAADRAAAGAAVAELAQLLEDSPRADHAAACYRRLGREFGDVVCRDGKTGKELVEALPADGAVRKLLDGVLPGGSADWPIGDVKIARASDNVTGFRPSTARFPLAYQGHPGPFLAKSVVMLQQDQRRLLGRDALGGQRWQMTQTDPNNRITYNASLTYCRGHDHLLLLTTGRAALAVDTLGLSDGGEAKLRWTKNLTDLGFDETASAAVPSPEEIIRGRIAQLQIINNRAVYSTSSSRSSAALGPVNGSYVCFRQNRHLAAADPMTGEILWIRRDVPPGAVVFGDEELLLAVGADDDEAYVYRAMDGKLLGRRKVPRFKSQPAPAIQPMMPGMPLPQLSTGPTGKFAPFGHCCIGLLGRQMLVWRVEDGKRKLELFDPWQQRSAWPAREYDARSVACVVGDEAVGVFEPDGRFELLSLPGGKVVVDARLKPEEAVLAIHLFRSGDQYVLITNGPARPKNPPTTALARPYQTLPRNWYKMVGHGWVYSFDLAGKPLWPEPVEIENRQFSVKQPGRLPVLALFSQTYDSTRGGSSANRYQLTVECIDKRTGRKFEVTPLPATRMTGHLELAGNPEKKTVDVRIGQQTTTLTFTDEPIPPASPVEKAREP